MKNFARFAVFMAVVTVLAIIFVVLYGNQIIEGLMHSGFVLAGGIPLKQKPLRFADLPAALTKEEIAKQLGYKDFDSQMDLDWLNDFVEETGADPGMVSAGIGFVRGRAVPLTMEMANLINH